MCLEEYVAVFSIILCVSCWSGCSDSPRTNPTNTQKNSLEQPFTTSVLNEEGTELQQQPLQTDTASVYVEATADQTGHDSYTQATLKVEGDVVRDLDGGAMPLQYEFQGIDLSKWDTLDRRLRIECTVSFSDGSKTSSQDGRYTTTGPGCSKGEL